MLYIYVYSLLTAWLYMYIFIVCFYRCMNSIIYIYRAPVLRETSIKWRTVNFLEGQINVSNWLLAAVNVYIYRYMYFRDISWDLEWIYLHKSCHIEFQYQNSLNYSMCSVTSQGIYTVKIRGVVGSSVSDIYDRSAFLMPWSIECPHGKVVRCPYWCTLLPVHDMEGILYHTMSMRAEIHLTVNFWLS